MLPAYGFAETPVTFTRTVGVSPGTTTMQLNGQKHQPRRHLKGAVTCYDGTAECTDDEKQTFTVPAAPTPADAATMQRWFPYSTIEQLKGRSSLHGLGDATSADPRWGLVLLTGIAVFATTVAVQRFRR